MESSENICLEELPYHENTQDVVGKHCIFRSDTNHHYQSLVNSTFSFGDRSRKLKTFEAAK